MTWLLEANPQKRLSLVRICQMNMYQWERKTGDVDGKCVKTHVGAHGTTIDALDPEETKTQTCTLTRVEKNKRYHL